MPLNALGDTRATPEDFHILTIGFELRTFELTNICSNIEPSGLGFKVQTFVFDPECFNWYYTNSHT
jgi:hypothetical protein